MVANVESLYNCQLLYILLLSVKSTRAQQSAHVNCVDLLYDCALDVCENIDVILLMFCRCYTVVLGLMSMR